MVEIHDAGTKVYAPSMSGRVECDIRKNQRIPNRLTTLFDSSKLILASSTMDRCAIRIFHRQGNETMDILLGIWYRLRSMYLRVASLLLILETPYQYYLTSILSVSSLASVQVSTFFFAQSMWHLAYAIFISKSASFPRNAGIEKYHITLEILLLFHLESFKILQDTCAGIFDVLLRHTQGSFKLEFC